MKKKFLGALILLIVAAGAWRWIHRPSVASESGLSASAQASAIAQVPVKPEVPASAQIPFQIVLPNLSQGTSAEIRGLNESVALLFAATKSSRDFNGMLKYLKDSNQNPELSIDKNDYTGEMTIVRTAQPKPGTRYFHAQYFSDQENQKFMQHMSFEFVPGTTAFSQAVESVQNSFGLSAKSVPMQDGFAQWALPNGYVVWIKKLTPEDLKDNPFNAYGPQDVGTIRIAVELAPHDEEE